MIVSPSSSSSATSLTTLPVTPAGTMIQTARGRSSFATRSAADSAPVAPSEASFAIGAGSRFHTTISCPSRISRRVRLAPIRPRPIIPSCMLSPIRGVRVSSAGTIPRMTDLPSKAHGSAGIVPAGPGDAPAVAACVRAAYARYVERIGREPAPMTADYGRLIAAGEVWVIRVGEGIAGVLVLRPQPPALLVENVA